MKNYEELERYNADELEDYIEELGVSEEDLYEGLVKYLSSDTLKDFYLDYINYYDLSEV